MSFIRDFVVHFLKEAKKPKVKIPVEKGELGLGLDDPLSAYKSQILGGKSWEELSKQLNVLFIYNKNKHPNVAAKAKSKLNALRRWIEARRKKNPDFAS